MTYPPFEPHPGLGDGHRMTVASYLKARKWQFPESAQAVTERQFEVEAGNRLLTLCHWQADRSAPAIVLIHGLSGSADSGYMIGTADKAYRLGFHVVRLNLRNCGGSEHLATTLYHSGMNLDVEAVLRELSTVDGLSDLLVVGFSMGGNIALRTAGRLPEDLQDHVRGVAAVSPSLDLEQAVSNIDRGLVNYIYRQSFMRHLRELYRQKARRYPDRFDAARLRGVRTIFEFDERFTSKEFGFGDARSYYRQASALPLLASIRVPTLIVQALDDPLLPRDQLPMDVIDANERIELLRPDRGGHCAFIARRPATVDGIADLDRFWAENRVLQFCRRRIG